MNGDNPVERTPLSMQGRGKTCWSGHKAGRNCYTGGGARLREDSRARPASATKANGCHAWDECGGSTHKVNSDYIYFSEFSLREASWGKGVRDLN